MSANATPGEKPSGSTSLFQVSPGSTLSVSALLLASLVCNILAISSPFLEFSAAFQGKEFYSIPLTIRLMWDFDLYAAAILIVGFSLIFPFVKLAMLSLAIWVPMERHWHVDSDKWSRQHVDFTKWNVDQPHVIPCKM